MFSEKWKWLLFSIMQYCYSFPSGIEYINKVVRRILQFNFAETRAGFSAFLNRWSEWLKKQFHCLIKLLHWWPKHSLFTRSKQIIYCLGFQWPDGFNNFWNILTCNRVNFILLQSTVPLIMYSSWRYTFQISPCLLLIHVITQFCYLQAGIFYQL